MKSTALFDTHGISVCLVAIVKNETHIVNEMLESTLPYINSFFIADTGSTDETKQLIQDFMDKHKVPGEVIDIPWVNFGQARSELMKRCKAWALETKMATYAFMMDADDRIIGNLSLEPLQHRKDVYTLQLRNGGAPYKRQQIFKLENNNWHYIGAVHEYPATDKGGYSSELIQGDYYIDARCLGARNKDQTAKHTRDAAMLLEELQREPHNTRNMFYLALAYFYLGEWDKAIPWFHKRLERRHFWEEEWWSELKLAECYRKRNQTGDKEKAKTILSESVQRHRTRAEQSYFLSTLLEEEKDFEGALQVARQGSQLSKPRDYVLWFMEDVYTFWMPWQLFRMAKKTQHHEELLEIAKTLDPTHFAHKKTQINKAVRRACKKLKIKPIKDFPLYSATERPKPIGFLSGISLAWIPSWESMQQVAMPCVSQFWSDQK